MRWSTQWMASITIVIGAAAAIIRMGTAIEVSGTTIPTATSTVIIANVTSTGVTIFAIGTGISAVMHAAMEFGTGIDTPTGIDRIPTRRTGTPTANGYRVHPGKGG